MPEQEQSLRVDRRMRDSFSQAEGIPSNASRAVQVAGRRAPPFVFRSDGVGHQLCASSRAGLGAEAYIFCEEGLAGPGDEISSTGKGGPGSGVFSPEAPSLFPWFYGGGDDGPPDPEGVAEARCRWEDGSLGGGVVRVRYSIRAQGIHQRTGLCRLRCRVLTGRRPQEVKLDSPWMLSVNGSSNQRGSGAGIVLEGPNGVLIEQAQWFAFKASNNQTEYEALIAGMLLAKEMGARSLLAKSDSLLVTGHVTGEYQAKDLQMAAYLRYIQVLKGAFAMFELVHVPREQNARADLLAKLASSGKRGRTRTVIQETFKASRKYVADNRVDVLQVSASKGRPERHRSLTQETARAPSVSVYAASPSKGDFMQVCALEEGDTWMTPYRCYLADGILPTEPEEGKKVRRNAARYTLVDGTLFRHGFTHPILTCVSGDECTRIMSELHEGICGSHVGGRSLASKEVRAGFYWPTVRQDCVGYAQRCKQCQMHADWHKAPPEELRSIYSSWPFHTWGIDILGSFPLAIRQMKYLIVAIEYFTKWIEVEPVAQITAHKVQHFVWKNIVCRFEVPRRLVSDNGTQFASQQLGKLCA